MAENEKSYLGGDHELVRRPWASTIAGPPDGAARTNGQAARARVRERVAASAGRRASGGGGAKGGRPTQARAALSRASVTPQVFH